MGKIRIRNYFRLSVAFSLHLIAFFTLANCSAQEADTSFLNRRIDDVEIRDSAKEFNKQLYGYIIEGVNTRQNQTKFYTLQYTVSSETGDSFGQIEGMFFLNFRHQKMLPIQKDSSGFVSISYYPDSIRNSVTNHLEITEIFWDDLFRKEHLLTGILGRSKPGFVHTTKQRLNDSVIFYYTSCYRYGDSVALITKVNPLNSKIKEVTLLNPSFANKLYINKVDYGTYSAKYYYNEEAMIDSVSINYSFKRDRKPFFENYKIVAIDSQEELIKDYEFTHENTLLIYRLRATHKKIKNMLRGRP